MGVGRPHGEMHASDALELHRMRAELVEQSEVRAFVDVIVVHRPEHGTEAVGIEHVPFAAGVARVVADRLALVDLHRPFEEPVVVPLLQLAERLAVTREGRQRIRRAE